VSQTLQTWPTDSGIFALGDVPLQSGEVLKDAQLSWKTHGTLAPDGANVVIYPTSYSAKHTDIEWLISPDGVLDPTRWFIVIPDMFGNGLSSSPSNTPDYPALVTAADNVRAQHRLLQEVFGVTRVACAYGWSMGAQQAYHWAALFPEAVARAIIVCGSARTAVHNYVFLAGLKAILEAAPEHSGGGRFTAPPRQALRAFARIYAGWALSQDFYRAGLHLTAAPDIESFLQTQWEARYHALHAADLYAQLCTWQAADIAAGGDLQAALGAITARVLLLPGETDLYFRVYDNAAELPHLRHAALRPIPSIWGHRAGNPAAIPADLAFLKAHARGWLDAS
jgi:homoserine O-acetyltransferase